MLVKDCMTRHPVLVPPSMTAAEVQKVMTENHIRHLPVVDDGKRLAGLITRQRLALSADTLASLNVWEIARYLAGVRAKEVMLKAKSVHTITPNRSVERAAEIMTEHKIGCLPVLEDGQIVVGIVTRVDILRSFQEMMGLDSEGVRVTVRMPDQEGEFRKLMAVMVEHDWGVRGIGTFPARRRPGYYDAVLKIPNVTLEEVERVLDDVPDQEIVDVRVVA
jgi:acetoin utilization protein AcuB